jgi:cadmium resistance protein CadD (predicted permease)
MPIIAIVVAATVAFAAANIGDLFVLLLFFSDRHFRPYQVVIGQYLGVSAIIVLCLGGSTAASFLPHSFIRLLGIMPMAVGVYKLLSRSKDEDKIRSKASPTANVLSIAVIAFADCSDDLAVFTPLYARSAALEKALITMAFFILIGVWCALALHLTTHRTLGIQIRRFGETAGPWVLIGLGLFIVLW